MFYEADILCQRGELGRVWIAAHWDKKLSKNALSQYAQTKIVDEASTRRKEKFGAKSFYFLPIF